jgi:small neutral amino acid transporter SnatA (MarC family)
MFVINNVGGNLPILVDPLAKHIGYRESIAVFYAGFYLLSKLIRILFKLQFLIRCFYVFTGSILFFATMYFIEGKPSEPQQQQQHNENNQRSNTNGIDNRSYIPDQVTMSQLRGKTYEVNSRF